MNSVDLLNSK